MEYVIDEDEIKSKLDEVCREIVKSYREEYKFLVGSIRIGDETIKNIYLVVGD